MKRLANNETAVLVDDIWACMKLVQSTEGIVNIRSIFLYEDGSKMATQARSPLDEVILREVGLISLLCP